MLKPIDEACKRWWEWRYGKSLDVSLEEMWKDFNSHYNSPHIGGGLMYKTMLYEKLEEVANELYGRLQAVGVEYCGSESALRGLGKNLAILVFLKNLPEISLEYRERAVRDFFNLDENMNPKEVL